MDIEVRWLDPKTFQFRTEVVQVPVTFGTTAMATIRITGSEYAAQHASIVLLDGQLWLRSQKSVQVSGQVATDALLSAGSTISIGDYHFTLRFSESEVADEDVFRTTVAKGGLNSVHVPQEADNAAAATYIGHYRLLDQPKKVLSCLVVRAHDEHLQRPVALTMPDPHAGISSQKFIAAMTKSSKVSHLGIAPIYEIGWHQDVPYSVGPDYLQDQWPPLMKDQQPAKKIKFLKRLANTIDAVHQYGLRHGSIEVDAIAFDADHMPYLRQVGLGQQLGSKAADIADFAALLPCIFEEISPAGQKVLSTAAQHKFETARALIKTFEAADSGRWYLNKLHSALGVSKPSAVLQQMQTARSIVRQERKIGRYWVQQMLGKGAMGEVYLVHDPTTEREVAMKLLPKQFQHITAFQERFAEEAALMAHLSHEHIIRIFEYGTAQQPFITMAYVAGGDLAQKIQRKPLNLDAAVRIVAQIARALDHAHRNGIIHQDVKPANILFDSEDKAYLADFGVAVLRESAGIRGGTPAYMSPEQAQASLQNRSIPSTPQSDIYAIGVVLFEAITGRHPFVKRTTTATLQAHAEAPLPALPEYLPRAYRACFEKALAKTPTARYETASAFAEDLEALTKGDFFFDKLSAKLNAL